MPGKTITVILLGPTGSGKSSFVKTLTTRPVRTGDGARPCTTECEDYPLKVDGDTFVLIDTPGLEDVPGPNLDAIKKIAEKLHKPPRPSVTFAIYFYRITDRRFGRSARVILDIFKEICGPEFYPRVAFVTTMWNHVAPEVYPSFETLNNELGAGRLRLVDGGLGIMKFSNDKASAEEVLRRIAKSPALKAQAPQLRLAKELGKAGINPSVTFVRKTAAGKAALSRTGRGGGFCAIL